MDAVEVVVDAAAVVDLEAEVQVDVVVLEEVLVVVVVVTAMVDMVVITKVKMTVMVKAMDKITINTGKEGMANNLMVKITSKIMEIMIKPVKGMGITTKVMVKGAIKEDKDGKGKILTFSVSQSQY